MAAKPFYADIDLHKNQLLQAAFQSSATAPTGPVNGQVYFNTSDNNFYGWNGTSWINLSQVVTNVLTVKGEISNADTNPSYPSSPATGDTWFITTNAGTVGGTAVEIGDQLIYDGTSWFVLQRNLQAATESIGGFVQLATQAEANAGSNDTKAITPLKLAQFLINFLYARKFAINITSLAANTPTTVTHGLALAAQEDAVVAFYQGGVEIELLWTPTSVNAGTVTSNQALSNVKVVIVG